MCLLRTGEGGVLRAFYLALLLRLQQHPRFVLYGSGGGRLPPYFTHATFTSVPSRITAPLPYGKHGFVYRTKAQFHHHKIVLPYP